MVDRVAYLKFLEEQIERITAATMQTQTIDAKFEQLQKQVSSLESGLVNATKTLREYQQASERESEMHRREKHELIAAWERRFRELREKYDDRLQRQQQLMEEYVLRVNSHIHNSKVHCTGQQTQRRDIPAEKDHRRQLYATDIESVLEEQFNSVRSDVEHQMRGTIQKMVLHMVTEQVEQWKQDFAEKRQLERVERNVILKMDSLEDIAQKLGDQFDSLAELKSSNELFRAASLERSFSQDSSQLARDMQSKIDRQLLEMKTEVSQELQKLQHLRLDIGSQFDINRIKEDGGSENLIRDNRSSDDSSGSACHGCFGGADIEHELEERLWRMQMQMKQYLIEQQKDQHEKILALIRDKNELTSMTATILQHLMNKGGGGGGAQLCNFNNPMTVDESRPNSKEKRKSTVKHDIKNRARNAAHGEINDVHRQRKKQLKDLYKQIHVLELEHVADAQ